MLTANSNVSHYRILSKLGAGGMGEVFLAEDAKLQRHVALKIRRQCERLYRDEVDVDAFVQGLLKGREQNDKA